MITEIFPQTDEIYEGMNMDHDIRPNVKSSPEQPNRENSNPRSGKHGLSHITKPNCNHKP